MNIELINWLRDSKYRIKTLRLLKTQPRLSNELARSLNINRASMSRVLKGLREKGLVSGTSNKTRTVTYTLTEKGLQALKVLDKYFGDLHEAQ